MNQVDELASSSMHAHVLYASGQHEILLVFATHALSWTCTCPRYKCNKLSWTYLPRPRIPLAPLARQSRRSFSIESVVWYMARWALLIISISCLVVALWGLELNIAGKQNVIQLMWPRRGMWEERKSAKQNWNTHVCASYGHHSVARTL